VAGLVTEIMQKYQEEHLCKFLGAGVTTQAFEISPALSVQMSGELDVIPFVFNVDHNETGRTSRIDRVDEQADFTARNCVSLFGPRKVPAVQIGFRNQIRVDVDGHAIMAALGQHKKTCGQSTWNGVMKYANDILNRNIRTAFFNSTPQGGGVALMRHALVRFVRLLSVRIEWYVPRPRSAIFRITKANHNILQGVNDSDDILSEESQNKMTQWMTESAERYWLSDDGPLASREKG